MKKDKLGGNRDGLGAYEMLKIAFYHRFVFYLIMIALKCHMYGMVKKILGVR